MDNHYIFHHGGPPAMETQDTHFYIIAGLCDITKKIKNRRENYMEVIYNDEPSETISRVLSSIYSLKKYIENLNAKPIFTTITPSHLETLNHKWFDSGRTCRLSYSHNYQEMQVEVMKVFEEINNNITQINSQNGLATPMLHRSVMHNVKKGSKYFQHSKLSDGCHATNSLNKIWAKYIDRAIQLNRI